MKLVIYAGYYSPPYSPETIDETGLGGTEQCIINLAKTLKSQNPIWDIWVVGGVVYGDYDGIMYRPTQDFKNEVKSVDTIIGVSYIHYIKEFEGIDYTDSILWVHNTEYYTWWNGQDIANHRELLLDSKLKSIICLTEWHKNIFIEQFPETKDKIQVIGNGVDTSKFQIGDKNPNQYIYTSHAERGLSQILTEWDSILFKNPLAELKISTPQYGLEYFNLYYRDLVDNLDNVEFLGTLPQHELYKLMAQSTYWYYPSSYEETFCITALEMLGHGVQPITWEWGGLKETLNNFNTLNKDEFLDWEEVNKYLNQCSWESRVNNHWTPLLTNTSMKLETFYVLALNETAEIREKCENLHLPSKTPYWIKPGFDARKMEQEDWDKFGVDKHPRWNIEGSNPWWKRDVMEGELGCGLSHVDAWVDSYRRGLEVTLILEEDFHEEMPVDWKQIDKLFKKGYDLIYLGRNALEAALEKPIKDVKGWVEPDYTYNSHAYILSKRGVQILVEEYMEQYKKEMFAFDEFLTLTFGMTHRQDILQEYEGKTRLKAAAPIRDHYIQKDSPGSTFYIKPTQPSFGDLLGKPPGVRNNSNWEAWCQKYINPFLLKGQSRLMIDEIAPNVIEFPLFTEEFCKEVISLAEDKEWVTDRHEFYPTTDQTMESLGMQDIYQRVLEQFVYPIWIQFWELTGEPWKTLTSENFIAKYNTKNQGSLDLHHDSSAITLNVRLNNEFKGGGTFLPKYKTTVQPRKTGYAMAHPGNITHLHGGRPVETGTRYILVSFTANN